MLCDSSLNFIRATAEKYGASRVLLFGSCLSTPEDEVGDIDLAVEGLSSDDYHAFWDCLLWAEELKEKTVDMIRIEDNGFLVPIILDEGVEIYAEREVQKVALDRV
jgi:predicted nucleotidyltransferase